MANFDSIPFATGISVGEACERVITVCAPRRFTAERVPLTDALGRIAAETIVAPFNVPGFARSAMDGFALRAADLPVGDERTFHLIGTRFAGDVAPIRVEAGECLRITTGAPMPLGADTVVIKENVHVDDDRVHVRAGEDAHANVRFAGEDYHTGDIGIEAGAVLTPARLGMLASFGYGDVAVARRARAVLLTTGDELVLSGRPLGYGQIYDSNHASLGSLLREAGVDLLRHEQVRDDPAALGAALLRASKDADLVLTSGGVSAGEADFLPRLVGESGKIYFWRVRLRPGMPVLFGEIGGALLFALPGNPVSGIATFLALVRPGLDALGGRAPRRRFFARLTVPIRKMHKRAEFQRAMLESREDGSLGATPFAKQGSGMLRGVAEADALIIIPEAVSELAEGSVVEVLMLSGLTAP